MATTSHNVMRSEAVIVNGNVIDVTTHPLARGWHHGAWRCRSCGAGEEHYFGSEREANSSLRTKIAEHNCQTS